MGALFSTLIGKAGFILVCFTIIAIAVAVTARNWSCRKQREPREPKVVSVGPYQVVSVNTGASLVVSAGRRDRAQVVHLQFVQAPATGNWSSTATEHLKQVAGNEIIVQYAKQRLIFRGDSCNGQDCPRQQDEDMPLTAEAAAFTCEESLEARGPLTGIVFGASGINLNMSQVAGGYADCTSDAPKEYQTAKAKAQKSKAGIWTRE